VEFTEKVAYYCFNGMKSQNNFDFEFQEATCNTGNIWTPPGTWEQCIDSKYRFHLHVQQGIPGHKVTGYVVSVSIALFPSGWIY
jgi:hypothetical protein